ncbi:MAG: hypothetical protein LBH32_03740, partial [Dysgonamonadaceae bacterium]|nr:hypothetical protein [Dysgonamonadaceae bacterium]
FGFQIRLSFFRHSGMVQKTKNIAYYCSLFSKLRRDGKNGGAPHKPVLLISLIQAYISGLYHSREIYVTPELLGIFKSNWHNLVRTKHDCLFCLPFYHMRTEPFWELVPNAGFEAWHGSRISIRNLTTLNIAVKSALIDEDLYYIIQNKSDADILIEFLLDIYFSDTKHLFFEKNNLYLSSIENEIINTSEKNYKKEFLNLNEI